MKRLLAAFSLCLAAITAPNTAFSATPIFGQQEVSAGDMYEFVASRNPSFPIEIAYAYHTLGERYGIRGDIALCQGIIETGWFRFADGTAVTPDQYNFCGLGVTELGKKGNVFDSIEQGVTAQLQHLFAYACNESLPEGEELVDRRFKLVTRGSAPTWEDLGGRWAMRPTYGEDIMRIFRLMQSHAGIQPEPPMQDEITQE